MTALIRRLTILMLLFLGPCLESAPAQTLPTTASVISAMNLANNYFQAQFPNPGLPVTTDGTVRPSDYWFRAVYFEGLMDFYQINPQPSFISYAVTWGTGNSWGLVGGNTDRNANDQCAGQSYIDLYNLNPTPAYIANIQADLNYILASTAPVTDWYWIDAVQMAMPTWAKMGALTGNTSYYNEMYELYANTRNVQGTAGLYNPVDSLWWRDSTFVNPPYVEPNGKSCYWSRGNGWVYAALARVLDVLPTSDPHYAEYVSDFQAMSAALLAVQQSDGFWFQSLFDPVDFPGPETSGTALFTYGMAWGVRKGFLPADPYESAAVTAWNAMVADALHTNGFLGYVQDTGDQPVTGVTYNSVPTFQDIGVGCFLLAGSEIVKLVDWTTATPTPSSTPTSTPTSTFTPTYSFTPTASSSATPSSTHTLTATPSNTPTGTATSTASATPTAMPTQTASMTPSSTASLTASATASNTPTPTLTLSETPTASSTSTNSQVPPTSTETATNSSTFTATSTATSTGTPTTTNTPTSTSSATSTFTATLPNTPTDSTTATPSSSPTPSASATPSNIPTMTYTPSWTGTSIPTASPTATGTPTASATASSTPTMTFTSSWTPSATPSFTATVTFSNTASASPTSTMSFTPTETASSTPTNSTTPTPSASLTATASPSPTSSETPILTMTPSSTPASTASATPTFTLLPTSTFTPTLSSTPTASTTATPSASPTPSFTPLPTFTPLPFSTFTQTPLPSSTLFLCPNPVKVSGPVTLQISMRSAATTVTVEVFTVSFRMVKKITISNVPTGLTDISLPLTDGEGQPLANGLYYVEALIPGGKFTDRLLVLR